MKISFNRSIVLVLSSCVVVAAMVAMTGCASQSKTPQAETPVFERPEVVVDMIEAHGGAERWREAKTVSFQDTWTDAGSDSGETSVVTVEQSRRRCYIDFPGTDKSMAWDGEKAWSKNWGKGAPPRFMGLLTYYFGCLPFLAMDPGVHLEATGPERLWDDPTEYQTVRMTFEPGVGDTPNDWYVLYIDPVTKMLHACEYAVTYHALVPEGKTARDPNILVYGDFREIDGLMLPSSFTIYKAATHDLLARCDLTRWDLWTPFDESRMTMGDGMVIDTSTP